MSVTAMGDFGKLKSPWTWLSVTLVSWAIGILTMMWIAVNERVSEIGLMRALGATERHVQRLFLLEAVTLTVLGGICGIVAGLGLAALLRLAVPGMPVYTPPGYIVAALLGGEALDEDRAEYLDDLGNRNGKLDVGDFLAWLDRAEQSTSAAALRTLLEKQP